MILTVTLNPSVDRTVFVDGLRLNESNRVQRTETDAGGKGLNLSRVAKECGADTMALAYLGGEYASLIREVMASEEAPLTEIAIAGHTRLNVTIEDGSGEAPTSLNEKGPVILLDEREEFWIRFRELASKASWIAMGGSIPPGLENSEYALLTIEARKLGAKVLVDADGDALKLALPEKPDLIKPNREEISKYLGRPVETIEEALSAAVDLHDSGIRHALVSMGEDGVVYCGEGGRFVGIPPKVDVCSTIGSGDSLLAGFLSALEASGSIEDAIRLGVACGAATATTTGAEIARRATIDSLLGGVSVEKR